MAEPVSQPGLKWELNKYFEAEPTWTHDPDVEVIIQLAREHLSLKQEDRCTADYYMQGALNRIYLVRCPRDSDNEKSYIFRVSLPIDPRFKVSSDVATMKFIRAHTSAPVPKVLAFDSSHENKLGFAWTIMEMVPGRPLAEQWGNISSDQRIKLVRTMANIFAQVFRHQFKGIGNLYKATRTPPNVMPRGLDRHPANGITWCNDGDAGPDFSTSDSSSGSEESTDLSEFHLGRLVSMSFIWHKRVNYRVERGPFTTDFDWLAARIDLVVQDSDEIINDKECAEEQKRVATKHKSIATRLRKQLPHFFHNEDKFLLPDATERVTKNTALHHYDTSGFNVMTDAEGELTALLDWDGVSTVPLWKACQMPEFLSSTFIDEYGDDTPPSQAKSQAIATDKERLRNVFLEEMKRIDPAWVDIYKNSLRQTDFDKAVQLCDSFFQADHVAEWVQHLEEEEEYWSLQQRLLG